jgi:secernin
MCDTFVVMQNKTTDGAIILGKSADDQINEAHYVLHVPHKKYPRGMQVRATHLMIPQAEETNEIVLHKAFWYWGGEEGINEHGLSIGAEAAYSTLTGTETKDGLIGVDLLRIALERASTCTEAIELMARLLKEYGQGGNIEISGNSEVDLTYLISDVKEAWILEMAGREYAAKKVQDFDAISNHYMLEKDWGISSLPVQPGEVAWGETYNVKEIVPALGARERRNCSLNSIQKAVQPFGVKDGFDLLREHGENYHPATSGEVPRVVCMHAGLGDFRKWQAVNAFVSHVKGEQVVAWSTGTSANCLSIFKPIFLNIEAPRFDYGPVPCEHFDPAVIWWRHELLHRRAVMDFENIVPRVLADIEKLEKSFVNEIEAVAAGDNRGLKLQFMDHCFHEASDLTERWIKKVEGIPALRRYPDTPYGRLWKEYNEYAGFPM